MAVNYRQVFAIKEKLKKDWLKINSSLNNDSGIYILTREENGFRFGYIGQAFHILDRLISHSQGYNQHIDLSLKKHKLWSTDNPTGWKVDFYNYPIEKLNEMEQLYIKNYANAGYQVRNKTSGSQGIGKTDINERKPSRGYHDGLKQGYENARREVAHWFELHLDYSIRGNPTLNKQKAYDRFTKFIKGDEEDV